MLTILSFALIYLCIFYIYIGIFNFLILGKLFFSTLVEISYEQVSIIMPIENIVLPNILLIIVTNKLSQ